MKFHPTVLASVVLMSAGSLLGGTGDGVEVPSTMPAAYSQEEIEQHRSMIKLLGEQANAWRDLSTTTPTALLDSLTHSAVPVTVLDAPGDWFSSAEIEKLVALVDSEETCAPVQSVLSSQSFADQSTVGREARFMLEGHARGIYPPELNSGRVHLSAAEAHRLYETKWREKSPATTQSSN